eukprot:jgi/Ulvmu1/8608/UM046_0006.1
MAVFARADMGCTQRPPLPHPCFTQGLRSPTLQHASPSGQSVGSMEKPRARNDASSTAEMDVFQGSEIMHSKAVKALFTAGIVIGWYLSNIGVILLNKFLLSYYGFKFPVLLTLLHMIACSVLTVTTALLNLVPYQRIKSWNQFWKVTVLSVAFTIAIILGNASLRYIPVSFNQAIGATTPLFTAALGFIMMGTTESLATYLALVPVVLGIVVASGFEPSFDMLGFIICILATALRGFKSVLQGLLMSEPSERLDSFSLLFYMSPMAAFWLIITALVLEPNSLEKVHSLAATRPGFHVIILGNCLLAFFANLLNFLVTKHTSPLTLQVLGNVKGVVAAGVSVAMFQNAVSWQGCAGYAIAIGGVMAYSRSKQAAVAHVGLSTDGSVEYAPLRKDNRHASDGKLGHKDSATGA